MLRYNIEAVVLSKALVSVYLNTGCWNSEDRNRSVQKLQSLEQRELLKISEHKKRSFRYKRTISHRQT